MEKVKRAVLVEELESVVAGLSEKEILEQSDCFVFNKGTVTTYNDEVACRRASCLKAKGAVRAKELLSLLSKLPEDTIEVEVQENEFLVRGKKGRESGIRTEKKVMLDLSKLDDAGKWKPLNADFAEAVDLVRHCASTNEETQKMCCVHITKDFVEACDNHQIARFKIKSPVKKPVLIHADSIKHIVNLGMNEISVTDAWVHFRNPEGLVVSCRWYQANFPNLQDFMDGKGEPITLPKALIEAIGRAEDFADKEGLIRIELDSNKVRVKSMNDHGWYTEPRKIRYSGKPMEFLISAKLLTELIQKQTDCKIADDLLRVDGGRFQYVTSLIKEGSNGKAKGSDK